jgi:hypothetical protein
MSGLRSLRVTAPEVARSMAPHRATGTLPCSRHPEIEGDRIPMACANRRCVPITVMALSSAFMP